MAAEAEIQNRVANSGLINLDLADFAPKEEIITLDIQEFLYNGLVLKEKDFREKVQQLDTQKYSGKCVVLQNFNEAIVPLWAYFLLTAKLQQASEIFFGTQEEVLLLLWERAVNQINTEEFFGKRILVKGCTELDIPVNAYLQLIKKLQPVVKSVMFGEACSNVPILKN